MLHPRPTPSGECRRPRLTVSRRAARALIASTLPWLAVTGARAFEIDTGVPDLKWRWDNTIKYSTAWRVKALDENVSGPTASNPNPNLDDGDRNFHRGMISNRFDLLSEMDVTYQDFGARVSAAAWYDSVYNHSNANASPATANAISVPNDQFTHATRDLMGRKAEILDAFAFGKFSPGDTLLNLRFGRFTQLYGESLFFGSNGIAGAQTPVDVIKVLAVPNSQFKEILMPVNQFSLNWQLNTQISFGAYYQLEWRASRLPASGSYFSFGDFPAAGGERLLAGAPLMPGGGPAALFRGTDIDARNSGQGGGQVKFKVGDSEYGIYAARFHDKSPQFYLRPGAGGVNPVTGQIGQYVQVYGEGITTYGASFSTVVADANVAGELSFRHNMPLNAVGNVMLDPLGTGNGSDNALYPVGHTMHAQLSAISVLPASPLWQGASILGEIAYNRRLAVTKNASQLDPNVTRDAAALRVLFQPEYFQVLPGVDMQVPISVGVGLFGNSSVNGLGLPPRHGGDFTIGVKADYEKVWHGSLAYTHFFGKAGSIVNAAAQLTGNQVLHDRDFIALSIQRTF
ncbi:DUF1302 domain-containing protein [Cupriavidus necator]